MSTYYDYLTKRHFPAVQTEEAEKEEDTPSSGLNQWKLDRCDWRTRHADGVTE